jgi:alanyl-tRNA synthetase
MKTTEIRSRFIKFFEDKGHKKLASSSLVPTNDPTLLFTNAGMVQFKDEFTGKANPADRRVVTIQKCVRAGGKHNDLENVGFTARHHTFFEMMGNFSFGDYFKKEAISFAWEFLTVELKIPKDKLYVTAHHTDTEAADIWHKQEGIPKDRIFFRGDKDNFWEMGEVGPCGPCSEIFFDHGIEQSDKNADTSECILDDEDRYVEIWNLVFMQYEKFKEDGQIIQRDLPKPSVDTGAGLERISTVMQSRYNNFDTDVFSEIIGQIESNSGKKYGELAYPFRVVADHARSATMLLSDGIIPSNEGRGYVLRRIIRRAVRYLDLLEVSETCFYKFSKSVFDSLGEDYNTARENLSFVEKYLKIEEEAFRKTLASGLKLLEKEIKIIKKNSGDTLSGHAAFTLYDTHGFPLDLTEMILGENNLQIDSAGFEKEMAIQKERSKKTSDFSSVEDNNKAFYEIKEANGETKFLGYNSIKEKATLIAKIPLGDKTGLVFDKTPFYGEGGGQLGDSGEIQLNDKTIALISNTVKPVNGVFAHISNTSDIEIGKEYALVVNKSIRAQIMSNHTSTHLLQAALIKVLGGHVKQAGSSVGPTMLRFDFTQPEGMTKEQIKEVEAHVNQQISNGIDVKTEVMTKDKAVELGAMALFGEKYGNEVRVIDIPGFSIELCGGTHVSNTSDIVYFKIVSEGSLSTGVRRITAVSNSGAFKFINSKLGTLEKIETSFSSKDDLLLEKITQLRDNLSQSNKTIKELKDKIQSASAQSMFDDVVSLDNGTVFKHIQAGSDDDIRKIGDLFIDKFPNGIVLITSDKGDKSAVLLKTFKGNTNMKCSDMFKEAVAPFGGRGGGKPDLAQGSIDNANICAFIATIKNKLT